MYIYNNIYNCIEQSIYNFFLLISLLKRQKHKIVIILIILNKIKDNNNINNNKIQCTGNHCYTTNDVLREMSMYVKSNGTTSLRIEQQNSEVRDTRNVNVPTCPSLSVALECNKYLSRCNQGRHTKCFNTNPQLCQYINKGIDVAKYLNSM